MEALTTHGIYMDAPCGGWGTCGGCRVKIYSPGQKESRIVQACQTSVENDLVVEMPETYEEGEGEEETVAGLTGRVENIDPVVEYYPVELNLQEASCWEEVQNCFPADWEFPRIANPTLLNTMAALADDHKNLTAVVVDGVLNDFRPADNNVSPLGIALDLGTTTAVGALVDLQKGVTLSVASCRNRQRSWGADVISRAAYAGKKAENLKTLQKRAVETINHIISNLEDDVKAGDDPVDEIVIVGNSLMMHLLLGISPSLLVKAPFTPVVREAVHVTAQEVGIRLNGGESGSVYLAPSVSSYVGGDALAAVLATGMHRSKKPRLLLDIGTNGEMVLGWKDHLIACSTAAGPAFEGAHFRCGMGGTRGAVNRVEIKDGQVKYGVVGKERPAGICGSGVVDAVSAMLSENIITPRGTFQNPENLPESLRDRMFHGEKGPEFILVPAKETVDGRDISLNRQEIGEFQLAKAAMRAGIKILLEYAGLKMEEVDEILLAGTFGTYLRPESAASIGLWPEFPVSRVRPAGNAASLGARMLLLSRSARREVERLSSQVDHLNLADTPDFMKEYADAMSLGKESLR